LPEIARKGGKWRIKQASNILAQVDIGISLEMSEEEKEIERALVSICGWPTVIFSFMIGRVYNVAAGCPFPTCP